jgi:hypothetical protein
MITTVLGLLVVMLVVGVATRERRLRWRQLGNGGVLPEASSREGIINARFDLAAATEAYAAYLNAPRGVLDPADQRMFDEDLAKARAAVEMAWLQAKPVRQPD